MKKICVITILILLIFSYIPKASGENIDFDKNLLLADTDFTDFSSMSLSEIKNFLNQHGTILPQYNENGETASEIIFNAAQKYKISPKVLITTIQKEEGLISATTYNQHTLDLAMGYREPSTFAKQVDGGTKLLRDAFDSMAEEYGWEVGKPHKTLDNPKYVDNTVVPENKTTAALYLYTPYIGGYYQDNGAYIGGNYLFVKIYTRWFGKSKKLSSKFIEKEITFYIPEGITSIIPITVTNNGEAPWKKGFSLTTILSQPETDINSAEIEQNVSQGESITLYVQIPPLGENLKIHTQLFTDNGEAFGETEEIEVIPVKITAAIKIDEQNIKISVVNKTINIPYFVLKEELHNNTGNVIQEKIILNGENFAKNNPANETIKTPDNTSGFQVVLKCIGSNHQAKVNPDILAIFFTKPYSTGKIIFTVNTTPKGASITIDKEKMNLVTPLSIPVTPGSHHILIEKEGFKSIEKYMDINEDTEINFPLEKTDFEPPKLSVNKTELVNSTPILLKGKATDNVSVNSIQINGQKADFDKEGNFSLNYNLRDGENKIMIKCIDEAGNITEDSLVIILDRTPPGILVNSTPPSTPNLFIKLNIKTADAVNLYINGNKKGETECTEFIKLKIGKNIINIVAEDEAGNKAVKDIIIAYSPLPPSKLQLYIGKKYLYINSLKKTMDTAPIIKNGRTLLPVRAIIESLGGKIFWKKENREVTILINGAEIHLFIGKNRATVNGKEVPVDENEKVYPIIINSRTYLPLRFIVENIGGSVEWNAQERKVTITYPVI